MTFLVEDCRRLNVLRFFSDWPGGTASLCLSNQCDTEWCSHRTWYTLWLCFLSFGWISSISSGSIGSLPFFPWRSPFESWLVVPFPGGLSAFPRRVAAVPRPAQCRQPWGCGFAPATPLAVATRTPLQHLPNESWKGARGCAQGITTVPPVDGSDGSRVIGFWFTHFSKRLFLAWKGARWGFCNFYFELTLFWHFWNDRHFLGAHAEWQDCTLQILFYNQDMLWITQSADWWITLNVYVILVGLDASNWLLFLPGCFA